MQHWSMMNYNSFFHILQGTFLLKSDCIRSAVEILLRPCIPLVGKCICHLTLQLDKLNVPHMSSVGRLSVMLP